jgi:hypothetical protein
MSVIFASAAVVAIAIGQLTLWAWMWALATRVECLERHCTCRSTDKESS